MRFFTPLPNFLPWIKAEQAKRKIPVIEAGCGDGDLLREMRAIPIPAIGVDPRYAWCDERPPEDLLGAIVPMEAHNFSMVKNSPAIILVCRPCHSGFPIEIFDVMHDDSVMYYVGLKHNIDTDTGTIRYKKVLKEPVGKEGEFLWILG